MKRHYASVALFLVASFLSACWMMGDRGYRMEPIGMEKVGNQDQWSKKFDGFELQTNRIDGLVGEWWIDPQLTISTGPQPVTIERIDLQTGKGVYPANKKNQSNIIPALSNHEMLSVSWQFSENTPASEIMGDSSRLLFHLKVGGEERTAEIEYRRSKCC